MYQKCVDRTAVSINVIKVWFPYKKVISVVAQKRSIYSCSSDSKTVALQEVLY